jgi:hemolysin III
MPRQLTDDVIETQMPVPGEPRAGGSLRRMLTGVTSPFWPARTPQTDHRMGGHKPRWRGRQHAIALVACVPAVPVAIAIAPPHRRLPMAVYMTTLVATLGVSAGYHTLARTQRAQSAFSRADRATIYGLIAGTSTATLAYAAPSRTSIPVLAATWAAAGLGGVARATGKASKTATVGYVVVGWGGVLAVRSTWARSRTATMLLAAGGLAYTAGAVMYATHRPVFRPATFGYHEAFHSMTLVGITTHYAAVTILAVKARG